MSKLIAVLRGINVGGNRKILMADLKELCSNLGWKNVESYIQSGNLAFQATKPALQLENELEQAIKTKYGYDVPVIVKTADELIHAVDQNPFNITDINPKQLHIVFLKELPAEQQLNDIKKITHHPDEFCIIGKNVFLNCVGKYHQSKLTHSFFEKNLGVKATARNWKTMMKLVEMSK